LRRVWLSEDEVKKFYEGQANQMLWPLFHMETDKARFFEDEWEAYQEVNLRFARAASQEMTDKAAVVWFHDYQFATAPAMLRDLRPEAVIVQFWHIPWPPWEIFRQHPKRRELLLGLLGCDLIGMHIGQYCQNFLDCIERELRLPVNREKGEVIAGDRIVGVRAFPISIDADSFDRLAGSPKAAQLSASFRAKHGLQNVRLGIGVERGDYTKGIMLRLEAIAMLLKRHPEWKGRFTFLQVSPVSRGTIPAYRQFQREMKQAVRSLNARYGTDAWKPVLLLQRKRSPRELAALYRMSDVMVVSARNDGMNLVAKEFVAARADLRGVLVLSEFAGASEEMQPALLLNPFDIGAFAQTLQQALLMPAPEQALRMSRLRHHLFSHTVYDWITAILEQIDDMAFAAGRPTLQPLLGYLDGIRRRIGRAKHVVLFCDYDGVLAPIAARPQEARLEQGMKDLLTKLRDSARVLMGIISGRALEDLMNQVGIERLTYAGNHGLEISGPRVQILHPAAEPARERLRILYDAMRAALQPFPGALVEDKQLGFAVHYRLTKPEDVERITDLFHRIVAPAQREGLVRVTTGKFLLEVRPDVAWDKGRAILWLLRALCGSEWRKNVLPIYIGDDVTDEDAFRALRHSGIAVHVGPPPADGTAAQYRLESPSDVAVFLEWLIRTVQ
jgi:trehalose-phosphatase